MTSWGNSPITPALSSALCITVQFQTPYMSYNNNKYVHYIDKPGSKVKASFLQNFATEMFMNITNYNEIH